MISSCFLGPDGIYLWRYERKTAGNYNITLPKDHPAVRVPPDYEHGFAFRTRQRSSYDHFVLP